MSIIYKIFLSISTFTVIFITIFISYIIDIESKNSFKNLSTKINYNELVYKSITSQLLFDFNKDILYSNINFLYLDPEIVKIELIDYSTVLDYKLNSKKYDSKSLINSNIVLETDGQILGELNIYYTKDIINNYLMKYQDNIIQFSIVLVLILFIIIYFFIYKFTKSIKELTDATTKISSGDLTYEIGATSNDEVGVLSNKFEIMRKSLKDRIETIHQQLEFQQVLMDTVSIPIYIQDVDLKYIGFNKAFLDFFGLKKDEVLGKTISELQESKLINYYKGNDKNTLIQEKKDSLQTKIYNLNNELRDVISNKNIFLNHHREVEGTVGTIIDITDLKNTQKELNQINKTLEEKVTNRTVKLEETIASLKTTQTKLVESEKMASLGGLVAGVAHELNTPVGIGLTGITHFIQITKSIKENYLNDSVSKEEFESYLDISNDLAQQININLERTAHLIRSFKQISVDQVSEQKENLI